MAEVVRQTLFAQLAEILRQEIAREGFPGLKLPSERALAARFGVSLVTMREALGVLREGGLIERRHGSGSFVCERRLPRIGVVLDFDIAEGGLSHFYRGATQAARRHLVEAGYEAPLYAGLRAVRDGVSAVTCREFVTDVQAGRLRGVVAVAARPDPAWLTPATRQGLPVVGSPLAFRAGATVDYDQLVHLAVAHLRAAGCRRLALLDWRPEEPPQPLAASGCRDRWQEALAAAGLAYRPEWVGRAPHPSLPGAGWEELRAVWAAAPDKPDGLLIGDDLLYADAAAAIRELGIRVPEHLAVVAHANRGSRVRYPFPTLTLEIDPETYGRLLADKVLALLRDGRLDEPITLVAPRPVWQPAGTVAAIPQPLPHAPAPQGAPR